MQAPRGHCILPAAETLARPQRQDRPVLRGGGTFPGPKTPDRLEQEPWPVVVRATPQTMGTHGHRLLVTQEPEGHQLHRRPETGVCGQEWNTSSRQRGLGNHPVLPGGLSVLVLIVLREGVSWQGRGEGSARSTSHVPTAPAAPPEQEN